MERDKQVKCVGEDTERPKGRAAYWDRQFQRACDLIGKVVLYDPRGRDVGKAPSEPIIGVVLGDELSVVTEFSPKYGPLVTIGYGERQKYSWKEGGSCFYHLFYSCTARVPIAACREVTLDAAVCGPVS